MNQLDQFKTVPTQTRTQQDYILLDGSGSMFGKWMESIQAIEAYVQGVRAANILSDVTLHIFDDGNLENVYQRCPIGEWVSLRDAPPEIPMGGTPLYAAINRMGLRLRDLDPPRASIVIVTDGDDTEGGDFELKQARAILDWMRAKGWQVTFIGAAFNNEEQGRLLGGSKESVIGVNERHLITAASALAKKRKNYSLYGAPMHWSEDEQQNFGGYLSGPSK